MPALSIFEKRNALALDRAGDDGRGLSFHLPNLIQSGNDLAHVVPINGQGVPTEGAKLRLVGGKVVSVHGGLTLAQPVDVYQSDQIIQAVIGCQRRGFPDRSLCHFSIAEQDIDGVRKTVQVFPGQCHADTDREALTERARPHFGPGETGSRVAFEFALETS